MYPEAGDFGGIENILNHLSMGVVCVSNEGVVTYMNREAERMLDVPVAEVLGKKIYMLPLRNPLYKVLSEPCRESAVEVSIHGRLLRIRCTDLCDAAGTKTGELTEIFDASDERREKLKREEYVAMMTHDLKSPLTVVSGYAQAMKRGMYGDVNERQVATLEKTEQNIGRIRNMIEDILDTYRLEVGLLQVDRYPGDLAPLVTDCCRDFQAEADAYGLDFTLTIDKVLPQFPLDAKQLSRVLHNLIANAIKFTPRNGSVSVTVTADDDAVRVSVADSGIGIPKKDIEKIFTKYYRSSKADTYKGTGLGLTITRAIVEAHGGAIEVTSTEGKGSTFTVVIPLVDMNEAPLAADSF